MTSAHDSAMRAAGAAAERARVAALLRNATACGCLMAVVPVCPHGAAILDLLKAQPPQPPAPPPEPQP